MPTDEVVDTTVDTTESTEPSFDLDAAVDKIGSELFPQAETAHDPELTAPEKPSSLPPSTPTSAPAKVAPPADSSTPTAPTVREAPKSWPKEMHEHWGKTPAQVQEYWDKREKQMLDGLDQYKQAANTGKAFQDVLTPYQQTLQAQGLDGPRAVQTLLNAHAKLTTGSIESRIQAYKELGANLKLNVDGQVEQPLDPRVAEALNKVQMLEEQQKQQAQAAWHEANSKAAKEVEAFANDPKNAYFNECSDKMIELIEHARAKGHELSLQDAYAQAVWLNPVTQTKELERRQTEAVEKFKENARLAALPKNKARGVNVTSRDSLRSPTEAAEGTMEDTLKSTLKSIKERTH